MLAVSTSLFLFLSLVLQDSTVVCVRPTFQTQILPVCDKTPPTLKNDFLQSCTLHLNADTCTRAWDAFLSAFVGKNASNVHPGDYSDYYAVIPVITPLANQTLFWSGTFTLVNILSMMDLMGVDIVSSANSLSSQIIIEAGMGSEIFWCSAEGLETLDFEDECSCSITVDFWAQFSTLFARKASGTTFYLVNGHRMPTFNTSSFFNRFELPNLDTNVVSRVIAMDIHIEGVGMACGQESMLTLQNVVEDRNLTYTCYDIYGNISDTETIAECVREIVDCVQAGTESDVCHILCNGNETDIHSLIWNGAKFFHVSKAVLLSSLLVTISLV